MYGKEKLSFYIKIIILHYPKDNLKKNISYNKYSASMKINRDKLTNITAYI